MQNFIDKVVAIAKFKYEIEEEVTLSFINKIEECYEYNFSPIKTVEVIAEQLFG